MPKEISNEARYQVGCQSRWRLLSSVAVFVNPTRRAEDCGPYRENNEGPAVAREALAQLAIFYVSVVTGTTGSSFGR